MAIRQTIKFRLSLILSGVLFSNDLLANALEDPIIYVVGEGQERRSPSRGGNSTIIRPQDETRFDANAHLKLDPSLTSVDQSRSSARGFSLPLFRGHDIRSTHVLLDGIVLQDPFTGFPLVEDVDLRSFGEMRIHKGLAPWDVPVAAPGGVVHFISQASGTEDRFRTGASWGDVQGQSAWLQGVYDDDNRVVRAYLRRHTAKGDYFFYDDHQTIRNQDDDFIRRKTNNESQATLASTHGRFAFSKSSLRWFGWNQDSEMGLPVRSVGHEGDARVGAKTSVASMGYEYSPANEWTLGIGADGVRTLRNFRDPSLGLSRAAKRSLSTQTSRGSMRALRQGDVLSFLGEVRRSSLRVNEVSNDLYAPTSDLTSVYVGAELKTLPWVTAEFKLDHQWHDDRSNHGNYGATLLTKVRGTDVWIQAAKHARSPSMLESLGNGADILGSDALKSEDGIFGEIGARQNQTWGQWRGQRSIVLWTNSIRNRIRIEPISVTQWRSENIDLERFSGGEVRESWQVKIFDLEAAFSLMRAQQENGLLLPRTPMWQGVGAVGVKVASDWTLRGLSRYQGRVYDDYENTSEIGDWWVHDVSLDRFDKNSAWSFGASVLNIANLQSLPVRDVATGQTEGRLAFQSQDRQPLPGRQWVIKTSVRL